MLSKPWRRYLPLGPIDPSVNYWTGMFPEVKNSRSLTVYHRLQLWLLPSRALVGTTATLVASVVVAFEVELESESLVLWFR